MKKYFLLFIFSCLIFFSFGQNPNDVFNKEIKSNPAIFLPALEIGYLKEQTRFLSGGLLMKTSVEVRTKKNIFFKLNFDAASTRYNLDAVPDETNIIEGTTAMEDLLLGVGYRIGKNKVQWFLLNQVGIRFYDYPEINHDNDAISVLQKNKSTGFNRFSLGVEYYLDDKMAVTFEGFFGSTLQQKDFWEDKNSSLGLTIGVTTALF